MLRRHRQIRAQVHKLVDAGLFALSLWLAHLIRSHLPITLFGGTAKIEPFGDYIPVCVWILLSAPLFLGWQGFYARPLLCSRRQTALELLKGSTLMTVATILVLFLIREQSVARSVVLLFGPISFLAVFVKEELFRYWVHTNIGQSQLKKRLILAGAATDMRKLEGQLRRQADQGIEIVAHLDLNSAPAETLVEMMHEHSANGVILIGGHTVFGQIERAIQACELEGVEVWLLADFFKTQISRTSVDDFLGRPTLVFRSGPELGWQGFVKLAVDVAGAFFLLLLLAPFMLIFALVIRLTSPGPVLFRQQRCGLNGRPFTMLKFRSMVNDAEQRKHELEQLNEMDGPVFKVSEDPRTTPFGRWLRKYSIDEWPQLVNVLRGEMSLVGPRPLPVDEVRRFDDLAHRRRLSVKPGLTCLWQVSGRSNLKDFKEWVRLDLEYIDHWSLWLDVKILVRTIPVVFSGKGAK